MLAATFEMSVSLIEFCFVRFGAACCCEGLDPNNNGYRLLGGR